VGWLRDKSTLWFLLTGAAIVAIDQFLKNLVIANFQPHVSYPVLGNLLRVYLTYNSSAAFSIGFGITWIFTVVSSIATLVLLWFGSRVKNTLWSVLAGALLGGVVGNLVDRITRAPGFPGGQVVDFIQIPFNFPIFNIADSAICVVVGIVLILVARGHKIGG